MNKRLLVLSIAGNVALLAGLLWARAEHETELRQIALVAMRGDEAHLHIHAESLAALESTDPAKAIATVDLLRSIIAVGAVNIKSRQRAGLGQ